MDLIIQNGRHILLGTGQTGFKVYQTSFKTVDYSKWWKNHFFLIFNINLTIIQNGGQSIVKPVLNNYQDVLTNRMQCLQIEDKVITLLNELWDQMCINTTTRCTVEIICEEDGMEFIVGELMVLIFYFMNEKKFLC